MLFLELYISFFIVGIFCVGGGYASVPLIQEQVIEIHNWLTLSEFMDIFTISQMTPGPIGINAATFVGSKVAGIPGAICATMGFVSPSLIIMSLLAHLLKKYGNMGSIRGILNGLRPAVVALIAGAGLVFLIMALYNDTKIKANILDFDYTAVIVMLLSYIAVKKKIFGVIQTIFFSGVICLIIYFLQKIIIY